MASGKSAWRTPSKDLDQRLVNTPYGKGLILLTRQQSNIQDGKKRPSSLTSRYEILRAISLTKKHHSSNRPQRDYMQVVELVEWDMATKAGGGLPSYPLLYTASYLASTPPMVGDDVICSFGRGIVADIIVSQDHNSRKSFKVNLKSWRLAGRSTVTCYLSSDDVYVVRKKLVSEMDVYERVEYAQMLKIKASKYFGAKLYKAALEQYAQAVDAVRYVQHDTRSSNEVRADLVEVMITCCNNAATCCWKLSNQWMECEKFAKSALLLIDALLEKRGKRIHSLLLTAGGGNLSDIKLFGEYKVKSLLLLARAEAEQHEYRAAVQTLKQAKDIIDGFLHGETKYAQEATSTLESQEKEVKRQLALCIQHVKAEKQREKKRAQAMFGGASFKRNKQSTSNGPVSALESAKEPSSPTAVASRSLDRTETTKPVIAQDVRESQDTLEHKEPELSKEEFTKRVSFHENTKGPSLNGLVSGNDLQKLEAEDGYLEQIEEEEVPWYAEHKEALILAGIGSALAASFFLIKSSMGRK